VIPAFTVADAMPGILYVVSTPIGNLEDITLRALRILRECDLIAAEDTRVTRKLLSHFDIHTPLTSYHQHTRGEKAESLTAKLREGKSIALVSDAGTPGISDPGADLIALALAEGIQVTPVPGPSAAVAALVVSGLSTGRFAFEGFPPRTRTDRREFFDALARESRTLILYEAPGRVLETLQDLHRTLGDRPVSVARELTKMFEEVYHGTLAGAISYIDAKKPRGEFVLVVAGSSAAPSRDDASSEPDAVRAALKAALDAGASPRDAVQEVAVRLRLPRRYVYGTFLDMTGR
jgi:16S rRNA (cytidine1402-2'-O)-methyltransferase